MAPPLAASDPTRAGRADGFFDEAFDAAGNLRPHYAPLVERLEGYGLAEFNRRRALIELLFRNQGITFTVYGDARG